MKNGTIVILNLTVILALCILALCYWGWRADIFDKSFEDLPETHGKSEKEMIELYGTPPIKVTYALEHGATLEEYPIEIRNTYDPSDPMIDGIEIRELRWDYSNHSKSVFMHQNEKKEWIVFESTRWK